MMTRDEIKNRFLNPDDLGEILPANVNVNDVEEVQNFLNESADVFSDILLAR